MFLVFLPGKGTWDILDWGDYLCIPSQDKIDLYQF